MENCCKKYDYCKNSFRINQIDFEFYNLELLDKDKYGLCILGINQTREACNSQNKSFDIRLRLMGSSFF